MKLHRTARGAETPRPGARRRGASMIEFILVIPLLAAIIAITFFFGWAMMNQQHVKVSGRYAAWSRVRGGRGSAPAELNRRFFADKAQGVSTVAGEGVDQTLLDMVDAAGEVSGDARSFAEPLVLGKCPRSETLEVEAEFPTKFLPWKALSGPIETRHAREGVEWRREQVSCEDVVRRQFLFELDAELRRLDGTPSAELSRALRTLYNQKW